MARGGGWLNARARSLGIVHNNQCITSASFDGDQPRLGQRENHALLTRFKTHCIFLLQAFIFHAYDIRMYL